MSKSANKGRKRRESQQNALLSTCGDKNAQTDAVEAEGKVHKSRSSSVAGKVPTAADSATNTHAGISTAAQNSGPQARKKSRQAAAASVALQDGSSGGTAPVGGGKNEFLVLLQGNSSPDDSEREIDGDGADGSASSDDQPHLTGALPSGGKCSVASSPALPLFASDTEPEKLALQNCVRQTGNDRAAPTCSGTLLREEVLVLRPGPTPGETEGDQCPAIVDLVVATGERQSGLGNMRCGRCSAVRSARRSSRSVPLSASGANSQIGRPKLSKRSKLVCPKANPDKKVPVPAGYE